jgi:hypothetical protein
VGADDLTMPDQRYTLLKMHTINKIAHEVGSSHILPQQLGDWLCAQGIASKSGAIVQAKVSEQAALLTASRAIGAPTFPRRPRSCCGPGWPK